MATFADKYRRSDGNGGGTSFASQYRKDASGKAPLGAARDEYMKLVKKQQTLSEKLASAQQNIDKYSQQANRWGQAVSVLEGITKSFVRPAISLYSGITQPMRSAFNMSPAASSYNVPVLGTTETYQGQAGRVVSDIRSTGGSLGRAAVATAGIAAQPAIDVLSTVYTPAKVALGFKGGGIVGAGLQGAKIGAPVSGAQSLADSAIEGKNLKQAAIDAAKATLTGGAAGFTLGAAGGAIGAGVSSFAKFYRRGAQEATEQVAKKTEVKPPVKTVEKKVETKAVKDSDVAEAVTGWTSGAPKSFNDDVVSTLKSKKIGVNELPFDKDGNITLYRKGDVEPGKPQSYTTKQYDQDHKPYVVNKNDIVANLNSKEASDFMSKNFTRGDREIALDSFERWKKQEQEVVVMKPSQEPKVEVAPKTETPKAEKIPEHPKPSGVSESPVLKELNRTLSEAERVNTDLPTTTFKKEFSESVERINADPKKAYNDAVYGSKGEGAQTRSSLQLALLENAKSKGDDKAIAEIGMAAAKHARKSGQEVAMFRALYDADPTNKLLIDLAGTKLKNIESRYPKILRRIFKESGDDAVTSATKIVKKKAPTIKEAQSIIDNFICK